MKHIQYRADPHLINRKIAENPVNDMSVIHGIEKILIRKRGYVFAMPAKGSPVIALMSGGLDTTVVIAMLLHFHGVSVYPLFINRKLPHEKKVRQSVAFFSQYFRTHYPRLFHEVFEMELSSPPDEVKRVLLERENDIVKHKNRKGVPLQPSLYAHYGAYYAKYLEETGCGKVRTIIGGWLPSNSEWYGYESLQSLRSIMFNLCCVDGDFSWQFTSLPMEKACGHYFDKDTLVQVGNSIRLPFEKTWTCYKGERIHCGTCPPCETRMRAFAAAGVVDKTRYGDGVSTSQKLKTFIKKIIRRQSQSTALDAQQT